MQNIDKTGAKLVLIGDSNQISAVGAGQTLTEYLQDSEITKHKENFAILDEITRQKDSVSLRLQNQHPWQMFIEMEMLMN
jgi:ATP-dependent exoDNAse (exonuclease V) alpha subunit